MSPGDAILATTLKRSTTTDGLRTIRVRGSGVELHAVTAGDPAAPPALLLHGFPGFWYDWRRQIGPLVDAGFFVVALDQRGYNQSDKPFLIADYKTDRLVADVTACLDDLDLPSAAIVGHDWGGAVAWTVAALHPERVSRLVVINCPHPFAMQVALEGSWGQLARSWYMFAAQIPGLPERVAEWTGYRFLTRSLRAGARPGAFTEDDLAQYRRAWAQPGAMTAMVNWYRAAARQGLRGDQLRIHVPTLLLWGQRDPFLGRDLVPLSAAMCDQVDVRMFPNSRHWPHLEDPSAVNAHFLHFLTLPAPTQ